jgi:hypothetical protein
MILPERKRWLAARLRAIAAETAPAREWPAVATSLSRLANEIERGLPPRDDDSTPDLTKSRRWRRRR